jgi:hypothetical protein
MKRTLLLVLFVCASVVFTFGDEVLPPLTVSIADVVLAAQTGRIKDYFGKDLTVTGWGFVVLGSAGNVGASIDDKDYKEVAFTALNYESPAAIVDREVFLILPVTLVAKFPILKQNAINRLTIAHVRLAWAKAFLNPDRPVLMPLDSFDVLDSKAPSAVAPAPAPTTTP